MKNRVTFTSCFAEIDGIELLELMKKIYYGEEQAINPDLTKLLDISLDSHEIKASFNHNQDYSHFQPQEMSFQGTEFIGDDDYCEISSSP